ncbi:MAG TPA: phosphodiesterase [Devosia sp.]|nr:phosphodiesterase [Devosia sp.]
MLIAQISDIHILGPGELFRGIAPVAERLQKCVHQINTMPLRPDLVIVSGDVTDDGSPASMAHAARILSGLEMPFHVIPGNHDNRQTMLDVFAPDHCRATPEGFINYVIDGYPLRLIALDSVIEGEVWGELCPDRLNWLRAELDRQPDTPTLIFVHHPPVRTGVMPQKYDRFGGADRLRDMLDRHRNIAGLACGHIHRATHFAWGQTLVSSAPSVGIQLGLDLREEQKTGFVSTGPALLLHHWRTEGPGKCLLVTHAIYPDGDGGTIGVGGTGREVET